MRRELLVIYDGGCRFCRFAISGIRRLDRRGVFDFCPFGNAVAEDRLSHLPPETRYEQMHVATPDALLSGTAAARTMLRELPFGRAAVRLGFHGLYPLIVRYRWALGRLSPERPAVVTCGDAHKRHVGASS